MIITIDGPAGTGKSTVAQSVADRLDFDFLDTGAMYRAVALAALRRGVSLESQDQVAAILSHLQMEFDWSTHPPELLLNHEPVSLLLRDADTTRGASLVATIPVVRERLVYEQRRIGRAHGRLVTEGRDQGSVVFPDAEVKIYLTATPHERARRRVAQLERRGVACDLAAILLEIQERDTRDATRAIGPLKRPEGATEIDTTELTQDEVIDRIVAASSAAT